MYVVYYTIYVEHIKKRTGNSSLNFRFVFIFSSVFSVCLAFNVWDDWVCVCIFETNTALRFDLYAFAYWSHSMATMVLRCNLYFASTHTIGSQSTRNGNTLHTRRVKPFLVYGNVRLTLYMRLRLTVQSFDRNNTKIGWFCNAICPNPYDSIPNCKQCSWVCVCVWVGWFVVLEIRMANGKYSKRIYTQFTWHGLGRPLH